MTAREGRLDRTLAVVDGFARRCEPVTTTEVADELDCSRRTAYDRLERLVERGDVESKKVGARGRVWWRPAGEAGGLADGPDARSRLVDDVPGMVYRCRAEPGRPMTDVSDAATELAGYDPGRLESGEVDWRADVVLAADRDRVAAAVREGVEAGESFSVEYRVRTADGGVRRVRERGRPVPGGGGAGDALVGVVTDVTDVSEAAGGTGSGAALTEQGRQLRSLVDAVDEYAIFMLDPDGRVRTWNSGAERIKGYDADAVLGEHVSLFYTDEDRAAGVPEENLAAAASEGVVEDEGWRVRADGERFRANVTITAVRDDDGDLEGYAKVTRDMTERREYELAVREERDLLERVLETSPTAIGIFDHRGEPRRVNPRFGELLGYDDASEYELGEQPLLDESGTVVPYPERPAPRALATGEPVRDRRVRVDGADGRTRWLSVNAEPLEDGEDGVVVTMADVTRLEEQARRLERRRDELENELRDVFDRVDDAFFALDDDWRFTHLNERAATLLDRSVGELVGREVWEAFPEAAGSRFETEYERALGTQEAVSFEEFYPPLEAWFEVTAYPSESGLSVYFRDVTERVERERELERYETIVEAVGDGIYVVDEDGRFTQVNEAYAEQVGVASDELVGSHVSSVIDDESRLRAAQRLEAELVAGERSRATLEAELPTGDGGTWHGEATFAIIPSGEGDGYERVGVVRDVTERVERERELERYETIVETVGDGVYAVDDDARFVLVNEAFCELTGYDRADLLGAHATTVHGDEVTPQVAELAADVLEGERSVASVELDVRTRSGERVPCETRFAPYPLAEGHGRCGVVRDVTARIERERERERRVRQGSVVAGLGRQALESHDLDALMQEATRLVAETLDGDYCKVLDLDDAGEALDLRAGVGWDDGLVGEASVSATDRDSQAGYTLETDEPVVVEDLEAETRFDGPDLLTSHDVRAGVSVVIGPVDDPWGILGTHDTARRTYAEQDVDFVQSVAHVLAAAIRRRAHERELERQRNQLAALDDLHGVVRETTDAVLEQSTREEVEWVVCEGLANSSTYRAAWIGGTDGAFDAANVRAAAGDDVPGDSRDDDRRRLIETVRESGEPRVERVGPADADGDDSGDRDAGSAGWRVAVPLVHDGLSFGVLCVSTARSTPIGSDERAAVEHLGEIVGHAISGVERKRALMSEELVELEYRMETPAAADAFDLPSSMAGSVSVDDVVPLGEERFLAYGTVTGDGVDVLDDVREAQSHWQTVTLDERRFDDTRFRAILSEPPVQSAVAAQGGEVVEATLTADDYRLRLHLPPNADVRAVTETVQESYPGLELVSRTQRERSPRAVADVESTLTEELTDRQRTALEVSYRSGFFEWPRDATGEEVAETLDVSPSTFHQHLRTAERKLLAALLS
jgi:PAS domain S-box-containing protein